MAHATFQRLHRPMWLETVILDSADMVMKINEMTWLRATNETEGAGVTTLDYMVEKASLRCWHLSWDLHDKMQLACKDLHRASKAEKRARAEASGASALGWFNNTKYVWSTRNQGEELEVPEVAAGRASGVLWAMLECWILYGSAIGSTETSKEGNVTI